MPPSPPTRRPSSSLEAACRRRGGPAHAPLGVLVGPAARAEEVAAALPDLSLIAVEFPKFRDGRGFSLARTLRERYGFTGEIRAVGHILPDQYRFLLRCGVSTVALPEGADPAPWQAALGRFGVAYQPAAADEAPLDHLRRRARRPIAAFPGLRYDARATRRTLLA